MAHDGRRASGTAVGALAAALAGCATLPVQAQSTLPPDPYGVAIADHVLLAVGADTKIWKMELGRDAGWAKLSTNSDYDVRSFQCAEGGKCVFQARIGPDLQTMLLDVHTSALRPLPVHALSVIWLKDGTTLYYVASADQNGRQLHAFNVGSGEDRAVGVLAAGETAVILPVDGARVLAAFRSDGTVRSLDDAHPFEARPPRNEGALVSRFGQVESEFWASNHPAVADSRSIFLTTFRRSATGGLVAQRKLLAAFPVTGPLPVLGSLAVDANDDLVGVFAGPQGRFLGVMCSAPKRTIKSLLALQQDETLSISGSHAGSGFVIESHTLSHSEMYRVLQLSPAMGGFMHRPCADTTAKISDAKVAFDTNEARFTVARYDTASADGTPVQSYVLMPKEEEPTHLIIDIYGADGVPRDFPYYHRATQDYLVAHNTAVAFTLVRGDGNLGYSFAMASKPPDRGKAVEDVAAIAADLAKRFPNLTEKPILRGGSAGAWLAMKTALDRPALFSGVIAVSGPYLLKQSALTVHNDFLTADDDLTPDLATVGRGCRGLHIRLLHAKDDLRVSYDAAWRFHTMLQQAGCQSEFVPFDVGGHSILIPLDRPQDQARKFLGYFSPP